MEYMSEEGYNKILAELKQLESVDLPRVREAIAEARAQGDLSENFEYHAQLSLVRAYGGYLSTHHPQPVHSSHLRQHSLHSQPN